MYYLITAFIFFYLGFFFAALLSSAKQADKQIDHWIENLKNINKYKK